MSESIFELVDNLPKNNITTMMLKSLDSIIPGEWQNTIGFVDTIRQVTGETDEDLIQQIGDRAVWLYNDKSQGYRRAMWLYQTVDRADIALGSAALANKVGNKIPLVGGLVAFCQINGIPGDSIGEFVGALSDYSGESLMRMTALVCVDGLIPLGPDFLLKAQSTLSSISPQDLESNSTFKGVSESIPGGNSRGKLNFIGESFDSVKGWMANFVSSKNLSPEKVMNNLQSFLEFSDNKLDYVAAFIDLSTNYYEHTGTQTLARRLIERAFDEI